MKRHGVAVAQDDDRRFRSHRTGHSRGDSGVTSGMSVPCLPPRVIDVEAVTIRPGTAKRAHAPPEKVSRRVTEETTFAETTEKPQQILHVRNDSPIGAADTRQ